MATQLTLVEQAKQGEPEAIAAFLNRPENKQPFRLQVRRRGSEYRLLAEADQVPDQQTTVTWIMRGLRKLAIAEMQTVTIYGKSRQRAKPDWQQRFQMGPEVGRFPYAEAPPMPTAPLPPLTELTLTGPHLNLSEHCFIRNLSLLSVNLTPPGKAVTQTVLSFAALPNTQKLAVFPHVAQLLRKPEPLEDEALEPETRAWIAEILALQGDDSRKLSIWLSRYCADPAATVEQLRPIAATTDDSHTPEGRAKPSAPIGKAATDPAAAKVMAARAGQLHSQGFVQSSRLPMWAIPTAWILSLLMVITLGIGSANRAGSALPCQPTGTAKYCQRAAQPGGDQSSMAGAIKAAVSASPEIEAELEGRLAKLDDISTAQALGWYGPLINFGANTLFTAIGLFVAVILYACYSYTLTGIYQMALVLGALETVMHLVPAIGLFVSVPLGVGAIGLTSRFVKDFTINWFDGYKPLATGAITIVAIKSTLMWMLYGAIAHFIA